MTSPCADPFRLRSLPLPIGRKDACIMNIIVSCKIVPDDQDIQVAPDRTLDYSKAKGVVSAYDLNAIEAAAQMALQTLHKA